MNEMDEERSRNLAVFLTLLTTATLEVAHLQIIKVPLEKHEKNPKVPKGVCIDKLCIDSTSHS